jgi:hypothetical protein
MNLIKKLLIAGCCAVLLNSCKKDNPSPDNIISYKVDGALNKNSAASLHYENGKGLTVFNMDGPGDITLFIDSIHVGVFNIGGLQDKVAAMYLNANDSRVFVSNAGSLVIDSYNGDQVSGTFRFTASADDGSVKNFTEGRFTAQVEDASASDEPPCEDTTYEVMRRQRLMRITQTNANFNIKH